MIEQFDDCYATLTKVVVVVATGSVAIARVQGKRAFHYRDLDNTKPRSLMVQGPDCGDEAAIGCGGLFFHNFFLC